MPPIIGNPQTVQALSEAKIILVQTSGIKFPLTVTLSSRYGVTIPEDQMKTIPNQETFSASQAELTNIINQQRPTDNKQLLVLLEANAGNGGKEMPYDKQYFARFPDVDFILCYGESPNAVEFAQDCPENVLGIILKNGINPSETFITALDRFSRVDTSAFSQQELIAQHPPGTILTRPKAPKVPKPKEPNLKVEDPGYTEPDVPDDDIDSNLPTEMGDEGETASVPKPGTGDSPGQTHKAAVQPKPKPKAPETAGSLFGRLSNNNDFGKSTGGLGGNVSGPNDIANAPKIRGGGEEEGEGHEELPR